MLASSSFLLLLATSHLLVILPFLTAGADVELASPLLATKGGSTGLSIFLDRSVKASLRRNEPPKFISQDTILDGYITTYNYVGPTCSTFFSGSTEKLNYCAAMSYSVYRKITAISSTTATEYVTKYYGDATCTETELISSEPPVKYETGVCYSNSGYSLKRFHESKITTDLQLPRFSSM
jgi:hypothetical protein